jgi:chorismate-pyruvate lyase
VVRRYYDKSHDPEWRNPFRSDGFLRNGTIPAVAGTPVPIANLPPFLRTLLVTDGTVTKILEAYFWEPVEVRTLEQEFFSAERPVDWIQVASGDRVLIRRAQLVGQDSGRIFVNAFSVIRTELIPDAFRRRLIDREIGIGVLIRDSGLESYREVLEIGVEPHEDHEQPAPAGQVVFRTYRIIIEREPVILITESFPLSLYDADATASRLAHEEQKP